METVDGTVFCSPGCRDVHASLGGETTGDQLQTDVDGAANQSDGEETSSTEAVSTVFLHVDGMYSRTCEAFLESVAEDLSGVVDASASYVTGTVRVEYDADRLARADLVEALSILGYSASPREEILEGEGRTEHGSERAAGRSDLGIDDMLGIRYVVGIVFGSFMLLPYVVMVYPTSLASFVDAPVLDLFTNGPGIGSGDGLLLFPLFLALTSVVLFFSGLPLLRGAYVSLKMRRPTTDLLVSLTVVGSYLYSTAAFLLGRTDVFYDLTILVATSVVAATFYESLVKQRAVDRLTDLTVSHVDEAQLHRDDGTTETISVDDLEPGDRILVRQGERVPVDGSLAEGGCTVDESVVTGESLPVRKQPGEDLVGGSVVTDDAAIVRVGDDATSSVDRITTAVWDLQSAHHGVQRRADALAARIVPALVAVALLVGVGATLLGRGPTGVVLAALTVFIVACPWALGLSTPLSVAMSIAEAIERGIVVFDETVFERLRDTDVVVFDKTGTLTTGRMEVIEADAPDALLEMAAQLERRASHPAADAIVTAFGGDARADGGVADDLEAERTDRVSDYRTHATGVAGTIDGTDVLVGTLDLFDERGWAVPPDLTRRVTDARGVGRLPVVVGRGGTAEGLVVVGDEPRDGWQEIVARLSDRGIEVVVLTGDDDAATAVFADHPGVSHVFARVPPTGKTATIRRLQADGHVTMVGDGTNDAPALAAADLGIALGSGTALASEAADVALVEDDLETVELAFDLADAARRRLTQNHGLALVYNAITIPAAIAGLLNPLVTALAVAASGGLVAVNASRRLVDR